MPTIEEVTFDPVDLLEAGAAKRRRPVCQGHRKGEERCIDCRLGRSYSWSDLARDLDIDPSTPKQWIERGGLDDVRADLYATRLGLGPELVWSDYNALMLEADEASGAIQ